MLAIYSDFIPRFCPCCGNENGLRRADTVSPAADYLAGASHVCGCGLMYVKVDRSDLLQAAAGTDLPHHAQREDR